MISLPTLIASAAALAVPAAPGPAQETERLGSYRVWRESCFDTERPRTEDVASTRGGVRFAAGFVPRRVAGRVGAAPPATRPDGRRAAAEMGRAPALDGLPPAAADPGGLARPEQHGPSRATRVLLGGWIDAR